VRGGGGRGDDMWSSSLGPCDFQNQRIRRLPGAGWTRRAWATGGEEGDPVRVRLPMSGRGLESGTTGRRSATETPDSPGQDLSGRPRLSLTRHEDGRGRSGHCLAAVPQSWEEQEVPETLPVVPSTRPPEMECGQPLHLSFRQPGSLSPPLMGDIPQFIVGATAPGARANRQPGTPGSTNPQRPLEDRLPALQGRRSLSVSGNRNKRF